MYKRFNEGGHFNNKRKNCGRHKKVGNKTKDKMITIILDNRNNTASDLYNDKVNHNKANVRTIQMMLKEEGIFTRPFKVHEISKKN